MAIKTENQIRKEVAFRVAEEMMTAARTAPKGRGNDTLFIAIFTEKDKDFIAEKMMEISKEKNISFFARDAENVRKSLVLLIIGTEIKPLGLSHCGYCGMKNCNSKNSFPETPCAFNTIDMGIAIGSAVETAMRHKIDNRVFFSAGYSAIQSGVLPPEISIAFGIPLSISSKNPFFDRG